MIRRAIAAIVGIVALFVVVPEAGDALQTCVGSRSLRIGYCVNVPDLDFPDTSSVD